MAQFEIDKAIDSLIQTIDRKYEPEKIILFGSRSRGDAAAGSDLDLLVIKQTAAHRISWPSTSLSRRRGRSETGWALGTISCGRSASEAGRYMNAALFDEWVAAAEQGYTAAVSLDPHLTPAPVCFHAQQCVEKYLKAALVRHGVSVPRVHDLFVLNSMVAQHDARFGELEEPMGIPDPYAVLVRYPGLQVSPEDAEQAAAGMVSLREGIRPLLELSPQGH